MLYTDKQYYMEKQLVAKLDLMIKRLKGTDDCLVIIDGDEGMGKTNMASGICHYISTNTKREFGIDNIFFSLDRLIDVATSSKEKILMWDEGALGGLAVQWWKKNQQKFIQLLMVARKKKHFIVICIPKFHKLQEYIVVDRAVALIHVYARKNIQKGRFIYLNKKKKALLYDFYRRRRVKSYNKFRSFNGSFPKYMEKVFSEEELALYDKKKDEAILSIKTEETIDRKAQELRELKSKVFQLIKAEGIPRERCTEFLKIHPESLTRWGRMTPNPSIIAKTPTSNP